jgi:hypothetical protein
MRCEMRLINLVEHRATVMTEKDCFVLRYDLRRKKQLRIESRQWSIVKLGYRRLMYTDCNFFPYDVLIIINYKCSYWGKEKSYKLCSHSAFM